MQEQSATSVQVQLHAEYPGWSSNESVPHCPVCTLVHQCLYVGGHCGVGGGQHLPHGRLHGAAAASWGMCTVSQLDMRLIEPRLHNCIEGVSKQAITTCGEL